MTGKSLHQYISAPMVTVWTGDADQICCAYNLLIFVQGFFFLVQCPLPNDARCYVRLHGWRITNTVIWLNLFAVHRLLIHKSHFNMAVLSGNGNMLENRHQQYLKISKHWTQIPQTNSQRQPSSHPLLLLIVQDCTVPFMLILYILALIQSNYHHGDDLLS